MHDELTNGANEQGESVCGNSTDPLSKRKNND